MTKLLPNPTIYQQGGDIAQSGGAAPTAQTGLNGPAQGAPQDSAARQNMGTYPPGPQVGGAAQTVNGPLSHDQISRGNVPLNTAPTSGPAQGAAAPSSTFGTDSLLAQLARGQVILNQSTYGQPVSVPSVNGSSPQVQPNAIPQPIANGIASTLTVGAPATFIGD